MDANSTRRIRVLISPRSAQGWATGVSERALTEYLDVRGIELTYQFSRNAEDGREKAKRAIDQGIDTILVVGGDGIVNTIGGALMGSDVALGVIPAGSGNGFARHFRIPLTPVKAAKVIAEADRRVIDVGVANGRPFLVTCSLAWDAALLRTFEKSPIRGIFPYVFAAASEFITYLPEPFKVSFEGGDAETYEDPMVFTAANLTEYGAGARIAPGACPEDGVLDLVVVSRQDAPRLVAGLNRLFDGTFDQLPGVTYRKFHRMNVVRKRAGPMQVDGELVEAPAEVSVEVRPKALTVLVPKCSPSCAPQAV